MSTLHLPYIIERSSRGERTYDIYSRLLMDRIIFLGSQINDDVANIVIAQLLFLEADSPGKDIQLYINSPGGDVSAGLAIYDTMQHLSSPVATICMGMAASMGCFLLATGRTVKRSALPHARIMMHPEPQYPEQERRHADPEGRRQRVHRAGPRDLAHLLHREIEDGVAEAGSYLTVTAFPRCAQYRRDRRPHSD